MGTVSQFTHSLRGQSPKSIDDLFEMVEKLPPGDVLTEITAGQSFKFSDLYHLGEVVGRGGFGTIYEATEKSTMGSFAVKIIDLLELDDLRKSLLVNELIVLQTTKHKNLVTYHQSFIEENILYVVIEFCPAGSISEVYYEMQRPLTEEQIVFLCYEVLQGLSYLHRLGIIHRDVKGANMYVAKLHTQDSLIRLLTAKGEVKLADFGACAAIRRGRGHETFIGTSHWMAPEVVKNVHSSSVYNDRVDIWSLGITAIECAECDPPMADMHPMRALYLIPISPAPHLKNSHRHSAAFNDFVSRCLTMEANKRPSAATLLKHPIFNQVNPNAFRDIAAVADPWLGWSWGETESDEKEMRATSVSITIRPTLSLSNLLDSSSVSSDMDSHSEIEQSESSEPPSPPPTLLKHSKTDSRSSSGGTKSGHTSPKHGKKSPATSNHSSPRNSFKPSVKLQVSDSISQPSTSDPAMHKRYANMLKNRRHSSSRSDQKKDYKEKPEKKWRGNITIETQPKEKRKSTSNSKDSDSPSVTTENISDYETPPSKSYESEEAKFSNVVTTITSIPTTSSRSGSVPMSPNTRALNVPDDLVYHRQAVNRIVQRLTTGDFLRVIREDDAVEEKPASKFTRVPPPLLVPQTARLSLKEDRAKSYRQLSREDTRSRLGEDRRNRDESLTPKSTEVINLNTSIKAMSAKIYRINRRFKRDTTLLLKNLGREQAKIQKYVQRDVQEIWKEQCLQISRSIKSWAVEKEEIEAKLASEWDEFILELRKKASEGCNSWRFLSFDKRKQQLEFKFHCQSKHLQLVFDKKVDTLSAIHTKELQAWHSIQNLERQNLKDWGDAYRLQQSMLNDLHKKHLIKHYSAELKQAKNTEAKTKITEARDKEEQALATFLKEKEEETERMLQEEENKLTQAHASIINNVKLQHKLNYLLLKKEQSVSFFTIKCSFDIEFLSLQNKYGLKISGSSMVSDLDVSLPKSASFRALIAEKMESDKLKQEEIEVSLEAKIHECRKQLNSKPSTNPKVPVIVTLLDPNIYSKEIITCSSSTL